MKKRYLILMVVTALCAGNVIAGTAGDAGVENGCGTGCSYTISEDGKTMTITGTGANAFISDYAFSPYYDANGNDVWDNNIDLRFSTVRDVIVTGTILEVRSDAFYGNKLTSADIQNSLTSIEFGSFGWSDLKQINIPDSVETIGVSAFRATKLEDIIIPETVQTIGDRAFSRIPSLKSISIGDNTNLGAIFTGGPDDTVFTDLANLKIYCTGDTAKCDQNLKDAGYDNLTTIKATQKNINGVKYILDSKGNIVATSGDRTEKRIYTLEEAQARIKEIGKDHVTFRIRYK